MNTYSYKGILIRRCTSTVQGPGTGHQGRWIIQSYHGPTGVPWTGVSWADAESAHAQTLQQAREYIDRLIDDELGVFAPADHLPAEP